MNIYDKRLSKELGENPTIIKSRVLKTECTVQPTQDGGSTISTALHLDLGYICYISTAEIKHISEEYKRVQANVKEIQNVDLPESPEEPPLDNLEE